MPIERKRIARKITGWTALLSFSALVWGLTTYMNQREFAVERQNWQNERVGLYRRFDSVRSETTLKCSDDKDQLREFYRQVGFSRDRQLDLLNTQLGKQNVMLKDLIEQNNMLIRASAQRANRTDKLVEQATKAADKATTAASAAQTVVETVKGKK